MRTIINIILIFICISSNAQEFVKDTTKYERYKFETGILIPLGNLQSKIDVSQQYGFWYRTRIEHNDLLDLGFNIVVPTIKNSFVYRGKDSVFNVKPKGISVMVAFRMNKLYGFTIFQKSATIEWSSTFGASFFSFEDKENPEDESGYYTDENGNLTYRIDTNTKALSCLYAAQGVSITSNRIGIQVIYNFTPYNWFSKSIYNDFGKSSLSLQFSYKF